MSDTMAMTGSVKDELSRVDVTKPCCRKAEMAAMLRFSDGLHIMSGQVVVEARQWPLAVPLHGQVGAPFVEGGGIGHIDKGPVAR